MTYEYYKIETERELMIDATHKGITVNMTVCTESDVNGYKDHYYEIKLSEGEKVIYTLNHGNLNRAFNEADRLRKCLLIGRCNEGVKKSTL